MKNVKILLSLLIILTFSTLINAQVRNRKSSKTTPAPIAREVRSSAAYAEILLQQTELEAELEELLVSYKEEFPKVKELRYELGVLKKELARILQLRASESDKLTLALGKLMVRKAALSTNYWTLKNRFNNTHPKVKRAKRKLEIFEKAIKKIL